MASRYQPDVALLDCIEMPGPDGIEVARRLTADGFRGRIVIVTTFSRPGYLAAAMAAGASGSLLKDAPAAELATAIRRDCTASERVVDPALAAAALAEGASPLTAREAEVLAAARGHASIADLAGRLHLARGRSGQPPVRGDPETRRAQPRRSGPDRRAQGLALTRLRRRAAPSWPEQ